MAGVAAAAVALGVTQLVAAFVGPRPTPAPRSGRRSSTSRPARSRNGRSQTFGTADKLLLSVLVLAVIAVIAAVAALVGDAPRSRSAARRSSLAGVAGCAAVLSRAGATIDRHRPHRHRHRVRRRGAAAADLGTVHRRRRRARQTTPTCPTAAGGCRCDAGASRPRALSAASAASCCPARGRRWPVTAMRSRCPRSTSPRRRSRRRCSPKALRCRRSSPATTTSTGSTPR